MSQYSESGYIILPMPCDEIVYMLIMRILVVVGQSSEIDACAAVCVQHKLVVPYNDTLNCFVESACKYCLARRTFARHVLLIHGRL